MLSTRKQRVTLVRKNIEQGEEINLAPGAPELEIESFIIDRVSALHRQFIDAQM